MKLWPLNPATALALFMAAAVMLSVLAIPVSFIAPDMGAALAIWALRALFMGLAGAVLLVLGMFMVGGVSR